MTFGRHTVVRHPLEKLATYLPVKFRRPPQNRSSMSRYPLVPEVTLALAIKPAVILAAALFVFSPKQRPKINAEGMRAQLIGPAEASRAEPRSLSP